jgi:hypothetical protein
MQATGEIDSLVFEKAGKLQGRNSPEPCLLQFREVSPDPSLHSSDGGWNRNERTWIVSDLTEASK